MDFEEYRQIKAINASALKAKSMKAMRFIMDGGEKKETEAMRLGRFIHKAVLEPKEFLETVVVYPGATRRGKEWEAFKAEHDGDWIVKQDEYDELMAIHAEVMANKDAVAIIEASQTELTLKWDDTGVGPCKARLDGYSEKYGILEIKKTKDAEMQSFARQFAGLKYDIQLGWYSLGVEQALKRSQCPAHVIAIEVGDVIDVAVYRVPTIAITIGKKRAMEIAKKYRACEQSGNFEGVSSGLTEMVMPAWYGEEEMAAMFADSASKLMED